MAQKIQVEVEVFPDPEYCCNENWTNACDFFAAHGVYKCSLFNEHLFFPNETIDDMGESQKCEQCKKAYSLAKEFEDAKGKI